VLAIDVMLTHYHDNNAIIISKSPSIAGDFQIPNKKDLRPTSNMDAFVLDADSVQSFLFRYETNVINVSCRVSDLTSVRLSIRRR